MAESDSSAPVTELLGRWAQGDEAAFRELVPLVYDHLRRLSRARLAAERGGHTLETDALLHEAFVRMAGAAAPRLADRHHFFRLASRVMRNVLVDHARARKSSKRGAEMLVTLSSRMGAVHAGGREIEQLHDAIESLAAQDPAKAEMIDLVYFGGYSGEEAAEALAKPLSTFYRELDFARAWLKAEMTKS